jgi:hypothetical protein
MDMERLFDMERGNDLNLIVWIVIDLRDQNSNLQSLRAVLREPLNPGQETAGATE